MSHKIPSPVPGGIRFINETESIITGTGDYGIKRIGGGLESDTSDNENENGKREHTLSGPKPGKKTRGRVKIEMRFIENKLRRYTTFSKRKTGIMKKAFELSTLTGTQVMLLVASETGHVYTFATRKLQPMITSESGKALIQTCLNSPDGSGALTAAASPGDVRMNPVGFEEPELSYAVDEESDSSQSNVIRPLNIAPTSSATGSSLFINSVNSASPSPVPMEAQRKDQQPPQNSQLSPLEPMQLTTTSSGNVSQNSTPKPESAALKSNNVAVQLPQGVVFSQPGYPGTPIAVAAPGGSNQALYRIQGPGGQSQMVAMAGIAASPAPAHQPPATSNNNNNKPKENANTSTAQVPTPVAIVPGTSNAGYVYQMPQGLMYAASSGLPEGYMLSIPQTPTLAIPQQAQEGQGGTPTQQYIFQLPVSPATGQPQLIQPILAPQAPAAAKVEKK